MHAFGSELEVTTLLFSKLSIFGIISTVGVYRCSPSSCRHQLDPNSSLTVWDASSSHLTLFIMLGAIGDLLADHLCLHRLGLPCALGQGRREGRSTTSSGHAY
jgi:cytochrome d ubiquinol oxidase subunit II